MNNVKKCLIEWIVSSSQPFLECDNQSFRRLVCAMNPTVEIPTRNTMKAWIFQLYEDKKGEVTAQLAVSWIETKHINHQTCSVS